jgi:hypothetical protein
MPPGRQDYSDHRCRSEGHNWTGVPNYPPVGFKSLTNQGYGAGIQWSVGSLGLTAGHYYRVQFMVHDGDQDQTGGDVGQACVNVYAPAN